MESRLFRTKLALLNFIGYCAGIGTASLLDPVLKSHVLYHARQYPHALIWLLLSPIVFITSYVLLSFLHRTKSEKLMLLGSFAPLVVFGGLACFAFPPERPHMGILECTLGFSFLALLTVCVRFRFRDFAFVSEMAVPFEARFERLKAIVATWQMIAVYGAIGFLAFVISCLGLVWVVVSLTVTSDADRLTLGQGAVLQIIVFTICGIFGPLLEAFRNTFASQGKLSELRSQECMNVKTQQNWQHH